MVVSTPHHEQEPVDDTIYMYDPGGVDCEDTVSPAEYYQCYSASEECSINTQQFSSDLLSRKPGCPWPEEWSSRETWIPQLPLPLSVSCQHPLDPAAARSNFDDWLANTRNPQPLLQIPPTQDSLNIPVNPVPFHAPAPPSVASPKLASFVNRTSQYWGGHL